jgi:transcriptional regulator with XRE-family HTH domain
VDDAGSTVPRRQLGRYLRDLREHGHITVTAAAKALEWSQPRIWRYETGQVPMHPNDVEAMCRLYGAGPETIEKLRSLASQTKADGWWHSYGDAVKEWFKLYIGLESVASRIREFEPNIIPGLLQTVEYMTEVIATDLPNMPEPERRAKVDVRVRRQGLLARAMPPAPQYDVVVAEAVLRRPLRARDEMARQLDYLVSAARRHNVTLRVLPLSAGLHRSASAGGFSLLDFPDESARGPEPSTVYMDGPCGAIYLDKAAEIAVYEGIWKSLDTVALDEIDSLALITALAKEYRDEA